MIEEKRKTKAELLADLAELRDRVAELEALEATRKGVGDAAARLEADHRALVRNAVYGIFATSVKDRFLTANLALAEMLGYETQAELLCVRPSKIYDNPAAREELIEKHRDAERVEGVEVRWKRKDGSRIAVRLSGRPVRNRGGELRGFELIAEDVTHQRRLEDQLRQAQKMEAVGRLTGGVAHDFNNILAVILSNAELVGRSLPSDAAEARLELEELKGAAERGGAMIKKLLGFSRREKLELQDVDLRVVVGDMTKLIERLLPDNIIVQSSLDDAAAIIRADTGAVEQVLLNLATNARDAMPDGGRLNIEVRRQHLAAEYRASHPWVEEGEYICVSVSDTGVGMEEETQRRIFEPFFTTKPPEAGTGLGMSMVYGLIKKHGGFVHVYSELGHGTVVRLHFRESDGGRRSPTRCVSFESGMLSGSETILLTEDEAALRRATTRVLESQGYSVLVAANGKEALSVFDAHRDDVDMVISDLVMPELGGEQLFEEVKKRQPTARFLMTSGFSATDLAQRTSVDPAIPFLQKPWTVTELLWSVRDTLDGNVGAPALEAFGADRI